MRAGAAASLGIVLLVPTLSLAQVYRWEDQRGTLHYTNTPESIPDSYRSQIGSLEPDPPSEAIEEESNASAAFARSRTVTRFSYTPGDAIVVNATISGTGPVSLILDTGADRTMIAPGALSRLGISLANATQALITGVTGTSHGHVVEVPSLEVGEARVGPLRIIAHDADLNKADGLLGRDFLEQFTVTIDSRERVVTLVPR